MAAAVDYQRGNRNREQRRRLEACATLEISPEVAKASSRCAAGDVSKKEPARSVRTAPAFSNLDGLTRASYCAARTIASVVKKLLSTAPMLMYQHSRSGVSMPGR